MLSFVKMQSAGNDYIYVDCLGAPLENPSEVAKRVSQRRYGVGSDGLVLICPSKDADAKMRIFNADGSEAKMCGNALRCVAKLLYESRFTRKSHIKIETDAGIRDVFLTIKDGKVGLITVDMGVATLSEMFVFECRGKKYEMRALDVGNEHQVAFVDDVDDLQLDKVGTSFEKNPRFEGGVNTEFCEIIGKNHLKVRVFERGSGETLACGTGACATVTVAVALGLCDFERTIKVSMRGGDLLVRCDKDFHLYLTGDAHEVFRGEVAENS